MKVKVAVPALRQLYGSEEEPLVVRRGCAWALHQITGETLPPLVAPPREVRYGGWFLEPIGP
jgi:hypothetical protein